MDVLNSGALKKRLTVLLPAGAVTGVLAISWLASPAAILGIGTGYNYGGPACTSANIAAAPASPMQSGGPVTLTGSSTTCTHPEYQFFIQSPGGSFVGQSWQPWNGTATATFNWATQGLGPGIYGIGVWARESGSANNYEAYAVATYTLTGICSTASIADSTSGISSPGTAVSFTASATDCGTKQISFRFWALVPGRSTWVMIQDYSTNPTFNWTAAQTSGSPQGTYQIGVWARAPGSTNSYDAYTIITHVLRASCGTAAISAAPGAGNVTLTATAAGCTGALFRFWVFDTTGTWTMVQDFSTINSFTMNTMTATKGHYQFGVWVKDPNSTNTYDSYAIITFYVT